MSNKTKQQLLAEHPAIAGYADLCVGVSVSPTDMFRRAMAGIHLEITDAEVTAAINAAYDRNAKTLQRAI